MQEIRKEYRVLCENAILLYVRLGLVTSVKDSGAGRRTGKLDHSQPPWAAPAALAMLDLHAWTRRQEAEWKRKAGLPARIRGGSAGNTKIALRSLCDLSNSMDDGSVLGSLRELSRWTRRARIVLGELELPRRLPRSAGNREPACPFCHMRTLRMWALRGIVRCISPECRDSEGRRPVARMEWSGFTGQLELIWQDGGAGLAVTETQ